MLSLLSLFALALPQTVGAQSYPGGGSGGGYPGGGSGGGYPGGGSGGSSPGGSYGPPAYSGGKTTVTTTSPPSPTQTSITPYGPNATTNAPGDWGGGAFTYINGGGGSGSVTCAGQITTTFTWNPGASNAPAPASGSVIVTETANVAWSGPGSTGDCGLPNPTTPASQPPNRTATHYTTNGGSAISLNCTPTASMSGSSPQPYQVMGGSAYVGYTAAVSPVSIKLTGPTPDSSGNLNILVGQGCTASLVGIPFDLLNNTAHPPTYSWTVSGNTFQSWNGESGTTPVLTVTGPGPLTNSTAHWFWSDTAGNKTVTCTATLTPPAGQGSAFSVTAMQQINLEVPVWSAKNVVGVGYIGTTPNSVLGIFAGPTLPMINLGYKDGSNWKAFVPIPPDFTGTGQWQYAQIVTPGEYETPDGGTEKQSTDTGITGLDDVFPYGTLHDTGGNFITDADSPNFPVYDTYSSVRLADAFNTYLMFKPPLAPSAPNSNDTQWVPLAESGWSTSFSASRPSTKHWTNFPQAQSVGPINLIYDFLPQKTHPQWNVRSINTTVFP